MSYGRGPPTIDGMTSLKVDNLTYRTTPEDLKRVFEKYGDVGDVYIPRHPYTRDSRGFAFVRFYDKRDCEDAMDALDGYILDGRELRVQMARYGRPTDPHRQSRSSNRYGGSSSRRSRSRSRSRSRRRTRCVCWQRRTQQIACVPMRFQMVWRAMAHDVMERVGARPCACTFPNRTASVSCPIRL